MQPDGLGPAGEKFWVQTVTAFDFGSDEDFVESGKLLLLEQAAKVCDVIAALELAASDAPLTVLGSARQQTINPLISEVRFQRGLLAQLVSKLGLPETEAEARQRAEKLSATRSRVAKLRLAR